MLISAYARKADIEGDGIALLSADVHTSLNCTYSGRGEYHGNRCGFTLSNSGGCVGRAELYSRNAHHGGNRLETRVRS